MADDSSATEMRRIARGEVIGFSVALEGGWGQGEMTVVSCQLSVVS